MFRLTLRLALILFAVLLAVAGLSHARPYDAGAVTALLDAPEDCAAPCWSGIRPGITPVDEAVALLRANPWVGEVTPLTGIQAQQHSGAVVWNWKGAQPFAVDHNYGGALGIERGIVADVTIPTLVPLADSWLTLGPASKGAVTHAGYPYARYDVDYVVYPERGLTLRLIIERPATFSNYWGANVTFIVQPISAGIGTPFRLPCWTICRPQQ